MNFHDFESGSKQRWNQRGGTGYRRLSAPMVAALLLVSCSNSAGIENMGAHGTEAAGPQTAARNQQSHGTSAEAVVTALGRLGAAPPRPVDTTAQECPAAGCTQAVVTDWFRIKSFATDAAAQEHATSPQQMHAANIVVTFSPRLPTEERQRYWSAIVRHLQSIEATAADAEAFERTG
jgi:hypothetical protein